MTGGVRSRRNRAASPACGTQPIASGNIRIDSTAVTIGVTDDSREDTIAAIGATDAGVTPSSSEGGSTADGGELYRVELRGDGPLMALDDGGTGPLAAPRALLSRTRGVAVTA